MKQPTHLSWAYSHAGRYERCTYQRAYVRAALCVFHRRLVGGYGTTEKVDGVYYLDSGGVWR